jgi:two-component system sensor histidine kinase YesM
MQLYTDAASYLEGTKSFQDLLRHGRTYLDRKYSREPLFNFAVFYLMREPSQLIYATTDMPRLDAFQRDAQSAILAMGESLDTRCRFAYLGGQTYLVRNLYSPRLERFGMLALGVDTQRLLAPLLDRDELWAGHTDIALDDYLYTADPADPPDAAAPFLGLYERGNDLYFAGQARSRDYSLDYRVMMDKRVVYAESYRVNALMLVLVLALLPVEALIMVFVHERLTKPLFELTEASRHMARGDLGVTVRTRGMDEVGQLAEAYNAMSLRIQHLIEKSFQEELALRDARIEALQSRINPHFLNNTLELMNWQARMEGSEAISGMIDALSTLLNAGLDRTDQRVVPLQEELTVADAYFYFLDQRFGDRLTVRRDIDPALLGEPVPRLVIETLLENAVEHGIAPAGGGWILLHIHRRAEYMCVDVANNGKRLTPEDSARVAGLLQDDGPPSGERLGIRNVNRRLKLLYGPGAGLTRSVDARGDTLARIVIPARSIGWDAGDPHDLWDARDPHPGGSIDDPSAQTKEGTP